MVGQLARALPAMGWHGRCRKGGPVARGCASGLRPRPSVPPCSASPHLDALTGRPGGAIASRGYGGGGQGREWIL
jgi:hypothetical protein